MYDIMCMFCFVCLVIINTESNWNYRTQEKLMNKLTLLTNVFFYIFLKGAGGSFSDSKLSVDQCKELVHH